MLITPEYVFQDVTHITPAFLAGKGITALVLDIDNTLTDDGSQQLPREVAAWLQAMRAAGVRLTIVSNGTPRRVAPFARKLGLDYVCWAAKPLTPGLMVARRRLGVEKRRMAMVGDQLYADRMAAALYGIPALMVVPRGPDRGAQVRLLAALLRPGRETAVKDAAPRFGPAGISDSFAAQGYKTSLDIPAYTAGMGLDAFEYQCGHGVRLAEGKARQMAALAAEKGIVFSVHAPYYISMSSLDEEKRLGSIRYLLQSAQLCRALGGRRIIFHPGSCGKQSRAAALDKALDTLRRGVEALDEAGYGDMTLCPETLGKIGQLGDLEEVLALCGVDRRIVPCIDFGHLNARTLGGIRSRADYAAILDRMGEALGDDRARTFHVHFSRIEFSAGGEKRHWTFADTQYGPEPDPLMELLAERRLAPVVICESAGTQAEDARTLGQIYRRALQKGV